MCLGGSLSQNKTRKLKRSWVNIDKNWRDGPRQHDFVWKSPSASVRNKCVVFRFSHQAQNQPFSFPPVECMFIYALYIRRRLLGEEHPDTADSQRLFRLTGCWEVCVRRRKFKNSRPEATFAFCRAWFNLVANWANRFILLLLVLRLLFLQIISTAIFMLYCKSVLFTRGNLYCSWRIGIFFQCFGRTLLKFMRLRGVPFKQWKICHWAMLKCPRFKSRGEGRRLLTHSLAESIKRCGINLLEESLES